MSLTIEEIRALMDDLEKSSLREFQITDGDFSLHLSKNEYEPIASKNTDRIIDTEETSVVKDTQQHPLAKPAKVGKQIVSPMVGTVYLQPKPDTPMFKSVGDKVAVGEVVAVIEAMKLMTEIHSEISGTISEILVENEEIVDYDKPLYTVIPD